MASFFFGGRGGEGGRGNKRKVCKASESASAPSARRPAGLIGRTCTMSWPASSDRPRSHAPIGCCGKSKVCLGYFRGLSGQAPRQARQGPQGAEQAASAAPTLSAPAELDNFKPLPSPRVAPAPSSSHTSHTWTPVSPHSTRNPPQRVLPLARARFRCCWPRHLAGVRWQRGSITHTRVNYSEKLQILFT